jgi:signal transduction histidine kinase
VTRSLLRNITAGYAGQVTEQQMDILTRASHRVDFLQKLIDDLLDLAAAKSEIKSHEVFEPISLEAAVERVVERFRVPAEDKNITLVWQNESAGKPSDVMATPDGLDRLFNNLVSNAVKYTPGGGRVAVTLSRLNGEIRVAVEDTGIGIPDEAMQHLFEEFYRAPNAKEIEREGTGLGLTIVKDLTTRFNGRVSVHSTLQEGTRFTVTFPVLEPVPS